jgi:hypothetical protein
LGEPREEGARYKKWERGLLAVCSAGGSAGRCALKGGGGVTSKSKNLIRFCGSSIIVLLLGMCLCSQIDLQQ